MNDTLDELIAEVLSSRKYRGLPVQAETVRDLLEREMRQGRSRKEALKTVRQKLHNIVAPYLGDPDYPQAHQLLEDAFGQGNLAAVRAACRDLLSQHASTRERLEVLEADFYGQIFAITGRPNSLLDLACGLNPFGYPWMGLDASVQYHAYDIHEPRIALINHYFRLMGLDPLGEVRDVLVQPPQVQADLALLFKEAHRMEQRRRGCSRPLWEALKVRYLAVSLPAHSLSGRFDLVQRQRSLVSGIIGDLPWQCSELILGGEMVFIIDKQGSGGLV